MKTSYAILIAIGLGVIALMVVIGYFATTWLLEGVPQGG